MNRILSTIIVIRLLRLYTSYYFSNHPYNPQYVRDSIRLKCKLVGKNTLNLTWLATIAKPDKN